MQRVLQFVQSLTPLLDRNASEMQRWELGRAQRNLYFSDVLFSFWVTSDEATRLTDFHIFQIPLLAKWVFNFHFMRVIFRDHLVYFYHFNPLARTLTTLEIMLSIAGICSFSEVLKQTDWMETVALFFLHLPMGNPLPNNEYIYNQLDLNQNKDPSPFRNVLLLTIPAAFTVMHNLYHCHEIWQTLWP